MFGFNKSHSSRKLSSYDFAILMVRRTMGLCVLACLLLLICTATYYVHPLVIVVFGSVAMMAGIWLAHHEKEYATYIVDWWWQRFADH